MGIELYKHNKTAYESILKHLETSNRTCVIHPTGSGKSFISLKWLYDNRDKKCLFLCPTNAIKDQLVRHIENSGLSMNDFPNLSLELYRNIKDDFVNNNFDCIVLDEFHRIGADVWGKNINRLLNNNSNAKVLGVSATPIRYLDDNRNMVEELFDNDISSEITLAQAIARKILPAPIYINAIYSFKDDMDRIEEKVKNYKNPEEKEELEKRLKEAKQMLEKADGLPEIFEKHLSNKKGKYIVFCKNKEHMLQMEEEMKSWVKGINSNISISDVSYEKGDELNKYIIDYFENNKDDSLKFLFSIEMLNEGVHVNDIDGVVMLRPTESPIIYMQQLGRALSVGHNDHPLVFDIVNNINTLDNVYELKEEVLREINYYGDMSDEDKEDIMESFRIFDEIKDLSDILNSLDMDSSFTWYDWYKLAKAYYEHHGDLNISTRYKTINGYDEVKPDDSEYKSALSLGGWIKSQREAYSGKGTHKISEEQIKLLDDIEMRWENIDLMDNWMKKYELAKAYYEHHGDLNISTRYKTINGYDEVKPEDSEYKIALDLGKWISRQREAYRGKGLNKITTEQIKLLDAIGMRWENIDLMDNWMKKYELAKAYYEHHGDLEINSSFRTINGYDEVKPEDSEYNTALDLSRWIRAQRAAYRGKGTYKITTEQIKLLDAIGMRWNNLDLMDNWMKKYELAKAYYENHGNLNIPKMYKTINGYEEVKPNDEEYENAISLGRWIESQRNVYNKRIRGKLTTEQIKLLDDIGMRWENLDLFDSWMSKYELAKSYYEHHGDLKVNQHFRTINGYDEVMPEDPEYKTAIDLGKWVDAQRTTYKGMGTSKINEEQIKLLEDIGMKWFSDKVDDKLQSKIIDDKNKVKKGKEILNRFRSLISKYNSDTLVSKEEINNDIIDQLNRKK